MTAMEERILKYWADEPKIKEARKTFFEKGIVKRELVEDSLAFSWLRCKYKNLSESLLPLLEEHQAQRTSSRKLGKYNISLSHIWFGQFDEKGNLKNYTGSASYCQMFSAFDFSEMASGYNGIAMALEQNELYMTIGFEHFSDHLIDYVVIGIPDNNTVIGIILPVQELDEAYVSKLLRVPFHQLFGNTIETLEDFRDVKYPFFRKDILVLDKCYKQFSKLFNNHGLLKVQSMCVDEAFMLAKEIHEKSDRKVLPMYYLNAQRESLSDVDALLNSFREGSLFIENYRWLNNENQNKLVQIIDSKLINSKAENHLYKTSIAIIIHEFNQVEHLSKLPEVITSLQMRLSKVTLVVPTFKDIGQQFKGYLSSEFEKRMAEVWNRDLHLSEEALNALTSYEWPNQYRELIYVVDEIAKETLNSGEIPLSALPPYLLRQVDNQGETMNLKAKERKCIQEVLMKTNFNIKKTSEILGITRATLYRKINEHKLNTTINPD